MESHFKYHFKCNFLVKNDSWMVIFVSSIVIFVSFVVIFVSFLMFSVQKCVCFCVWDGVFGGTISSVTFFENGLYLFSHLNIVDLVFFDGIKHSVCVSYFF